MFSFNPNADKIAAQYVQDRIADAQHRQLVQDLRQRNSSPARWRTIIGLVGNLFVALGNMMQVKSVSVDRINTISRPVS